MAKVSFSSLKRSGRAYKDFSLKDPSLPEPMIVWLRSLEDFEEERAIEKADELTRTYISGGFIHPTSGEWQKEPMPYPPIDGAAVAVSARLFGLIAELEEMQGAGDPAKSHDVYGAHELIECGVLAPAAWKALRRAYAKVRMGGAEPPKDASQESAPPES